MLFNNRWCNNIKIHGQACTPDLKMPTLSIHPFHLPGDFAKLIISCVCPHSATIMTAVELVASTVTNMQVKYLNALVFIMGDFNSCRLGGLLPSFQQYVDIPARRKNTLDLCMGLLPMHTFLMFSDCGSQRHCYTYCYTYALETGAYRKCLRCTAPNSVRLHVLI